MTTGPVISEKVNETVRLIVENINPDKIILFGSYARGTHTADSDIDLIIVKESNLPVTERGLDIYKLFRRKLITLDIKYYTPDEFISKLKSKYSFLSSVIKESKVLYERKD